MMKENFLENKIVIYLPVGNVMTLESTLDTAGRDDPQGIKD